MIAVSQKTQLIDTMHVMIRCRQKKKWESELLCLDCHAFSWRSYSNPDFMTPEQYQKQYWQQQAKTKA